MIDVEHWPNSGPIAASFPSEKAVKETRKWVVLDDWRIEFEHRVRWWGTYRVTVSDYITWPARFQRPKSRFLWHAYAERPPHPEAWGACIGVGHATSWNASWLAAGAEVNRHRVGDHPLLLVETTLANGAKIRQWRHLKDIMWPRAADPVFAKVDVIPTTTPPWSNEELERACR